MMLVVNFYSIWCIRRFHVLTIVTQSLIMECMSFCASINPCIYIS